MNRFIIIFCSLCLGLSLLSQSHVMSQSQSQAQKGKNLEVQVEYKGAGKVDKAHKIYVVLWDSPDFVNASGGGPSPVAVTSLSGNLETAKFLDIEKGSVYVSFAYDGQWEVDRRHRTAAWDSAWDV